MEPSHGHVSQGPNVDYDLLQHKVHHLENTLKIFQSEVELKMSMVEQIVAMRNEQLVLQKEFHDREHTLYEDILSKWNTVVDRASPGRLSTPYSKPTRDVHNDNSFSLGKRSSSTPPVSYHLRKRLIAKRCRISGDDNVHTEAESSNDNDKPQDSCEENEKDPLWDDAVGLNSDGDTDDQDQDQIGDGDYEDTEKKVFREVFSTTETSAETNSDPLWNHFLQEENGTNLICKHCHDKGFQKIYKLTGFGRTVARTHLKTKHKIHIDPPPPVDSDGDEKQTEGLEVGTGKRKKQPLLRHKNYLYTRDRKRNSTTYWCCRERGTCNGRIIIPRGGIIRESTGHSCLTTAADCDVYMFREKLKDLVQEHPMLSANDIITSAKEGQSNEVLQLLPTDDALRRTIQRQRRRKLLLTATST